ncbi:MULTISPECIES: MarR family winged helix-turn-helix transcriptional regulator [Gemmobacter]|jgi:DNA-binding MarR family transcriptional regulator|uniref:DNA-binding MarR family transcriptional regulator n=2 Tax=Gemmobacter TaxID=204456 RepID=A0A2T6B4R8_9RHOB|nr:MULTISPECIES: MarR family transcriptional regulator [Gemmobacter]PTX51078.1 DNA-binding MarR family transcriptional regulator [Gemmobacter caeni]TWJ01078.1 DNA-binding MarR family transcriptional regulator [Gemmobacter caeni]GHC18471.1 MarR family transcriptional regulator [Gemmobacter nanjingensis]
MTQPLPLSQLLCFALYSASHAVQASYKPLLDRMGLTYPQFLVLTLLWETDDQPMSRLAQALQLESNTLTPMLKRMESAGFLTRSRDAQDERQVRLRLTEKGLGLRAEATEIPACFLAQSGLDPTTIRSLTDEIATLRDRLRAAQT